MKKSCLLVGTGLMSKEYIKILDDIHMETIVIGRGETASSNFAKSTKSKVYSGGVVNYLNNQFVLPNYSIISVGVEDLFEVCKVIIESGIRNILVEKPGALNKNELSQLITLAKHHRSNVFIAYNRRFFASVLKAKDIIFEDGGVLSYNFEFTEWSNEIVNLNKPEIVKDRWFLSNSTHVADLAFYLGGKPLRMESFSIGALDWHKPSVFCGAGLSEKNALFNYSANWESPGRWSIEILTRNYRLIFRPMEKLQIQIKNSVFISDYGGIDYRLDEMYKPGLYMQTTNFLNDLFSGMCTLEEQLILFDFYYKMADYND